jgi:WD40 repeat protein
MVGDSTDLVSVGGMGSTIAKQPIHASYSLHQPRQPLLLSPPKHPITTPLRDLKLEGHEDQLRAVADFPDKRQMATASLDKTLHLWDLKIGDVEEDEGAVGKHDAQCW